MKIVSKKLLSILLAVCLLATIALPAGILSAVAGSGSGEAPLDASQTPVTEYVISTSTTNKTYLNNAVYNHTSGSRLIISFDYYVVNKNTNESVYLENLMIYDEQGLRGTYPVDENGSRINSNIYFQRSTGAAGIGHYEAELLCDSQSMWRFHDGGLGTTKVYVWNFSYRYKDSGVELTSTAIDNATFPNADLGNVTAGQMLSEYAWYQATTTTSATESSTSATESSTSATESVDPNESVVVNKINLSKFDSSKWNASSTLTFGSYGVFCYSDEYSILRPTTENNVSKLSFDYYLPGEVGVVVRSPHGSNGATILSNAKTDSLVLEPGLGSFEVTRDYGGNWRWYLAFAKNKTAPAPESIPDIYIWNVKMEYNGTTVETPTAPSARTDTVLASSITDATAADMVEVMTLADIDEMIAADNEYVTEIDFSASTATGDDDKKDYKVDLFTGYVPGQLVGACTLTFDYYLPDEGTNTFVQVGDSTITNTYPDSAVEGSSFLAAGRQKFQGSVSNNSLGYGDARSSMQIVQRSNKTMGKIYIWNVKLVKADGSDATNYLEGGYWFKRTQDGNNAVITKKVMLASELPTNPTTTESSTSATESSTSATESSTSATESSTSATEPDAPTEEVGNKINFSKFTGSFNSSSVYTGDPYGVFSYSDALSVLPADTDVTISFDYYLPGGVDVAVRARSGSSVHILTDETSNNAILQTGHSTFTATANYDKQWRWSFGFMKHKEAPAPEALPDMYIWNLKISYGDTELTTPAVASTNANCMLGAVDGAMEVVSMDVISTLIASDEEYVIEMDFSNNTPTEDKTDYTVEIFSGHNAPGGGATYTLTFDYYLPDEGTNTYVRINGTSKANTYPGSESPAGLAWLQQGRHKYMATGISVGSYASTSMLITQRGNVTMGKFYIWNISLVRDDGVSNTNLMTGSYVKATVKDGNNVTVTTSYVPQDELPADTTTNAPSGGSSDTTSSTQPTQPIDPDTPVANKINFSKFTDSFNTQSVYTGDPYGVFSYADALSVLPADTDVTISFDYYLLGGVDVVVRARSGSSVHILMDETSKNAILQTGHNTFTATANYDKQWRWNFGFMKHKEAPAPEALPDMYIWNLKISYGDTELTTPTTASVHTECMLAETGAAMEVVTLDSISALIASDTEYVVEMDFSNNTPTEDKTDYTVEIFSGHNAPSGGGTYTLTFDYYLPDKGTNTYVRINGTSKPNTYPGSESASGTAWLLQGRHSYKATGISVASYGSISMYITQRGDMTMGKFYIWNISLVKTGEDNLTNIMTGSYVKATVKDGNNVTVTTSYMAQDELPDTPEGGESESGSSGGVDISSVAFEDRVYLFDFTKYNWEDNDYQIAVNCWANLRFGNSTPYTLKEGDVLRMSFSYRVLENADGQGTTLFYNGGDRWGSNAQMPGTSFSNDPDDPTTYFAYDTNPEGEFVLEWTVSANDIKKQSFAPVVHQNMNYGLHKFYMWNWKLTINGSDENYLSDDVLIWQGENPTLYMQVLSIDPSEIPTVDPDIEVVEPDLDIDIDIDIPVVDDPTVDDPSVDDPTVDDPSVDDPTVDDPSVDDPSVDDPNADDPTADDPTEVFVGITDVYTGTQIGYVDGTPFPEGAYVSLYLFNQSELAPSLLDQVAGFPFAAFDVAVFIGHDYVNITSPVTVKLPIPLGFDASLIKLYMTDAYGDMYLVESEVVDGKLVFTTDVLGVCIMVNGDLGIGTVPGETPSVDDPTVDDPTVDDPTVDDPTVDDPSVDDPSVDVPNVDVPNVSPETGDSVIGVVIAALALVAAAAAMIISKKRTA